MQLLTPLLSLLLPKFRKRERNWKTVLDDCQLQVYKDEKLIWFHAASMGEFEQAKPIIEKLKKSDTRIKVLCSFYSPSGYENQKKYKYSDAVVYLPPDTRKNAKQFLDKFRPDIAVFIRYEIWHNFLHEINKKKIPLLLVAATAPATKLKFEFIKQFYSLNFSYFNIIYTVSQLEAKNFMSYELNNEIIALSDPRFDRIINSVKSELENPILSKEIFKQYFTIVAGSSWDSDEDLLIKALERLNKDRFRFLCIFVPHEPTKEHVRKLNKKIDSVLLSELEIHQGNIHKIAKDLKGKHLIVDSIGKLLSLYSIADAAYIGGAFGAGVHSVTEPAGYSIPLACGPKMKNSPDAVILKKEEALTVLNSYQDAVRWIEIISVESNRNSIGRIAGNYIQTNSGASDIIIEKIKSFLF